MEDDRFNAFRFKYYSSFHFGKCNIINFVIRSHEEKETFFSCDTHGKPYDIKIQETGCLSVNIN